MRTVTVETEVDIDLGDYVDEFLEEVTSDELKKELKKRKYVVIENSNKVKPFGEHFDFANSDEFKRHLCDIVGVGYYINEDDLLDLIKQKIR